MNANSAAPILVLWDSKTSHRFSGYITEILQIEGYNWFTVHDLSSQAITAEQLGAHSIVILTHVEPSEEVQEQVLAYVRQGGNLISLRPPEALAGALGFTPRRHDMMDRYVVFNKGCALNAGVEPYTLQFHGRTELYRWEGYEAQVLASFAAFPDVVTKYPAIAVGDLGQGHWAVFAYDLAESTVLFHQGRREQASTGPCPDPDGDRGFKPNDLFVGYLDSALCHLPQADLHQDAFVRILEWMTSLRQPLPRLWYFPNGAGAVAFINGDGDNMKREDLENVVATTERFGAPYTVYLMMENYAVVPPGREADLCERGHDFGQHAFAGRLPTLEQMRKQLREEMDAFRSRYGHESVTYRGHNVIWAGWMEMAKYLRENGVRMDTNFAAGPYFRQGYLNGSGLPVKFMDEEGTLLDIYEQCTMSTDDGWLSDKMFVPALSVEECIALSGQQADAAIDRFHTVYHPYFHPTRTRPGPLSSQRWLEGALAHCRDRGFTFVSGVDWVAFNDGRRGLRLVEYGFDPEAVVLEFALEAEVAVRGATLSLPYTFQGRAAGGAEVDGEGVDVTAEELEGRMQVLMPADYAAGQVRQWRVWWGGRK